MAHCPNCGSQDIQIKTDTNVNWGRAMVGLAAFGVVGAAVGAVTGKDRNSNVCIECGSSWKAAELYKLRQLIQESTGISIKLELDKHRRFMNDFINEVIPHFKAITSVEEDKNKDCSRIKEKYVNGVAESLMAYLIFGIGVGVLIGFMTDIFILPLIPVLCCIGLFLYIKKVNKRTMEKETKKVIRNAEKRKIEAEKTLQRKIQSFMDTHGSL